MTLDDVCRLLVVACYDAGGRLEWAKRHDFSTAYLSAVLLKKKAPSERLLDALGLEKVVETRVTYRRKKR